MCPIKHISPDSKYKVIRPLPIILALYIIGIIYGKFINIDLIFLFSIIILLILISIISFVKQWNITTALLFLIIFLIGIFNYNLNSNPIGANHIANFVENKKLTIVCTVLDKEYYPNQEKISFKVRANQIEKGDCSIRTQGLILVNTYLGDCPYEYGDVLKIKGKLEKPIKQKNFGEFNYELYLAREKIFTYLNIWQERDISKIGEDDSNFLVSFSLSARDKIKEITKQTLTPPYNYLLIGMLLGEKNFIPPALKEVFTEAGIMHILAVSGLHVGIIAMALLAFLSVLRLPKKLKLITLILILIMYASITGYRPSVLRATIMFIILIGGKLINRNRNLNISLFFAAFLILLLNPLILYDAGFLLSFIVTFFIINLSPILQELYSKIVVWIRNPLAVSTAAWIGIFPLSAYFFNKVSIISIVSNIFIIPLTGITVILGFVTFFIGMVSISLAGVIANINYLLLNLITLIAKSFSLLPFAYVYVAQPSILVIILYYLTVFFIIEMFCKKTLSQKIKKKTALIVLSITLLIIIVQIFYPADNLKVNFINVGEGDCILIEAPNKINILIDGGGTPQSDFDVGSKIVIPYLRRKGINKIDLLILTHPHLDHLEGLLPILRRLKVDAVLDSGFICDVSEYREFISTIKEKNIPYYQTKSGDNYIFSKNMEMLILNPPHTSNLDNDSDFNNHSIVVKLYYKNSNFLFTGDIEREAEKRLLVWQNRLNSDVLKLGHHGSSTSTTLEFLDKVDPVIAVITVGKNNFGHPSQKVIERLEDKNIKIYRTDENGTVIIRTNGQEYWIRTLRGNN
ncbi:MAG TPA: DNA internalization-related competence protein ComEC/Rec2 [Candidatus Atribacteria bacterium]|nr:MAG: DNA internalization-related competence protein ComEC/Rec2 [Atribacteria bacterium 34_128]HAJ33881.1 DNA internalization-related competence protein ComEC/Rec2 [Candidatus Atribacteria bacterium]